MFLVGKTQISSYSYPMGELRKLALSWRKARKFEAVGLFILGFVFSMIFKKDASSSLN